MWSSRPLPPQPGAEHIGYGLGWGSGTVDGSTYYGHGGGQQGTSTLIMVVPEHHAGVVVLINMDSLDVSALTIDLMKLVIGTQGKGK